jgi:hypothetical protein
LLLSLTAVGCGSTGSWGRAERRCESPLSFRSLGLFLRPVYRRTLQLPAVDLFTQCRSALLDGIVRHELVRLISVQLDLAANMIVEVQKTFVVQINYCHKTFDTHINLI